MSLPCRILAALTLLFAPAAMACGFGGSSRDLATADFLNLGPLLSVSNRGNSGRATGLGLEASYHHLFDYGEGLGLGGFIQGQAILGGGRSRWAAGAQGTFRNLGLELGLAYEGASEKNAGTPYLQLTPFATAGVLSLGVRVGIPLAQSQGPKPGHGLDVGLLLTLKLPVPLRLTYEEDPPRAS